MPELKKIRAPAAETEVDRIIGKEREEALRRFRSGSFVPRLKARLDFPPARRPFFLIRRPVLIPALGLLAAAAGAILLVLPPGRENGRLEAGRRFLTEALAKSELTRIIEVSAWFGVPDEGPDGRDTQPFARVLLRAARGPEAGFDAATSSEGGAPLRPVFSSKERFKILYGDRAIRRVLADITTQKEV